LSSEVLLTSLLARQSHFCQLAHVLFDAIDFHPLGDDTIEWNVVVLVVHILLPFNERTLNDNDQLIVRDLIRTISSLFLLDPFRHHSIEQLSEGTFSSASLSLSLSTVDLFHW
jgi:hypothetical protein